MLLSNKQITKALTILCVCAGWSAPLLFAQTLEDMFSRIQAYISFAVVKSHDKVKYEFFIFNLKFN